MANANLQTFLEDRLRALDPTIDLDSGSPAQVQFIEPVMRYLGTDPFETDIQSFISDRFKQEFPDVYSGDPGVVFDVFIKPLILLLEPFKRETETIKRNQSLQDPTVLSDEDADALVANVFSDRDPGSFSVGVGRILFPNPMNVQIEITSRAFTSDGLGFFPTNPTSITAEEMAFNKTGTQYFVDVPLKAENEGDEYNIAFDTLSGIEGVFGHTGITNLQKFSSGTVKIDTPSFVASAREALNERSLNTRRGATARLNDVFQTELRAVQVIGARDLEMERDILVGLSPGQQWITGAVSIWGQMALVQARVIDGEETDAPAEGDTLYLYLNSTDFPGVPQTERFVRLTVDELFIGPLAATAPYQMLYLVRWSGDLPTGVTITNGDTFEGGFSRVGNIAISSIPELGSVDLSAPNQEVHVFGHTDFYIRSKLQPDSSAVFNGLADYDSVIQRTTLVTNGAAVDEKHLLSDAGVDFTESGILPGDLVSIETGDDVGVYVINLVDDNDLYLNSNLTTSQTGIRYRVIRNISIDPFEPKILKFPFGSALANDLQTAIGSNLLTLETNDAITYGAAIGDIVRITTDIVAGDYTITGFDPVLGGQGILVDRAASATVIDNNYQIFTALDPVERPLVRIKEMLLLDSAKQSTGIAIPYADPVGIIPTCEFTSARVRGSSQRFSGFVLPSFATTAFTTYLDDGPLAAASGDRRYSLGFDDPEGWYFSVAFTDGSFAELDFRADPDNEIGDALEPASYFVAVSEAESDAENFPPVDPKPGECLNIKNGPNEGSYLIKNVVKFKHRVTPGPNTVWTYFIKIHGTFPNDIYGQLFDFLNDVGGGATVTELPLNVEVTYPDFFISLHESLGLKLNSALTTLGVPSPPSAGTLQDAIDDLTFCEYDWGDPARGTLRSYFMSPTLFQQNTGDADSTLYSFESESGDLVKFRPDVNRYRKNEIIPARLEEDADPKDYPRDLELYKRLDYFTQTADFTVGQTVTGASSGATATIYADEDGGALGILYVSDVVGGFYTNEIITDPLGGSAQVAQLYYGNRARLTDESRASAFLLGVAEGDILSVHEEVFFNGDDNSRQTAVSTLAGSTQVTLQDDVLDVFTEDMVGNLFYIEQGQDASAYRVVRLVDERNIILDSAMTESTPTILAEEGVEEWGHTGTDNEIRRTGFNFTPYIGNFITVHGISYDWQGSYEITAAPALGRAVISRDGDFPGSPVLNIETKAYFVITAAPDEALTAAGQGTELHGLRPIRMYESITKDVEITSVAFDDISVSSFDFALTSAPVQGLSQPYRIYKSDVRRVTPTEMESNTFGPLYYFDTEVLSLSPQDSANIEEGSFLTVDEGTYSSLGYRHRPTDRTRTYSMDEEGFLDISPRILPVGNTDSQDNYLNLVGSSVQVTYEQSELVKNIQEFADSAQDRVTSANILVRHFLPAYVSYDATYSGGSAPSVIAEDVIGYIDNLPVETPIDVSEVQDLIARRGGNPITPTVVQTLIHDWSRKIWLEFSDNQLGGTTTSVPYDGTPRVSFYVPGDDVSGQDPLPAGERINLTRQ